VVIPCWNGMVNPTSLDGIGCANIIVAGEKMKMKNIIKTYTYTNIMGITLKIRHNKSGHMAYNAVIWRKLMYMSLLYIINFYRNNKKIKFNWREESTMNYNY
jgi:hypothetical protein